jgi:hypothetical protein
MFIQNQIEDIAVNIISASLATNNVTNWQVGSGLNDTLVAFPCVKVICHDWQPMYKELNIGTGKAVLELMTCAVKVVGTNQGEGTSPTEFETVSDYVFNPFFANNIANTMSTNSLKINLVSDDGLEVTTLADGWTANQKFEVVCSRMS